MSKRFSKFLLFSAVAGAAAYGAYSYLQKKEQTVSPAVNDDPDDDFDDFGEDLDEDLNAGRERSYVSLNLDKAEAFATEAFHKAKEVFADSVQQVKETVKSVADAQSSHTSFTDLSETLKEQASEAAEAATDAAQTVKEAAEDTINTVKEEAQDTVEAAQEAASAVKEETKDTVEEFFDDET